MPTTNYILTLTCPDQPGIVHAVSGALLGIDANIVETSQFSDPDSGRFCMRTEFQADLDSISEVRGTVGPALDAFGQWNLRYATVRPRVLVLVSKFDHCLADLLYRWRSGQLPIEIAVIASNHLDCSVWAARYDVPYVHLPVTPETRPRQEAAIVDLVTEHKIDLVVLARYMQILSDDLSRELAGRAINIHHSFLPGFKGARPYHQAHERGVKLIGATAHFVTAELDEGPIIDQDVVRVDHTHTADQLVALGQDVERVVLARAVRYWAEDRVFQVGSRTVVFS
ncbi:MAG: formyltetrahydrofolate deformylase [Acidimicrobiales bacterium]